MEEKAVVKRRKPPLRFWLVALLPVSAVLLLAARYSPFFAEEIYARRIYLVLSVALNRLTGLLPFSAAEWLVVSLPLLLAAGLACLLFRLAKGRGQRIRIIGGTCLTAAAVLSAVLFWFVLSCGINYYRYPFSHYSGLVIEDSTKEDLYALCVILADRAAGAREELADFAENGAVVLPDVSYSGLAGEARDTMDKLGEKYAVLSGSYFVPKPVVFSEFMSRMETTGIFFPFTMEANVNVHCTPFTIPATMCHELSHLRGFMREDEANYIAYLACRDSDSPLFRYSGYMLALVYAANQLYDTDRELYSRMRSGHYTEGMLLDFREDTAYWEKYEDTVVSTIANRANDTYLKVNNQSDGTKSYGRMVDLLLAEYKAEN